MKKTILFSAKWWSIYPADFIIDNNLCTKSVGGQSKTPQKRMYWNPVKHYCVKSWQTMQSMPMINQ